MDIDDQYQKVIDKISDSGFDLMSKKTAAPIYEYRCNRCYQPYHSSSEFILKVGKIRCVSTTCYQLLDN
jgi:hypothetical protein